MSKFKLGDWVVHNTTAHSDYEKPIFEVTEVRKAGKYWVRCVKAASNIEVGLESDGDEELMKLAPEQKKPKTRVPEGLDEMDGNYALSILRTLLNDSAMDLSDWLDENDAEGVEFVRKNAQIKSLKDAIRLIERNQ